MFLYQIENLFNAYRFKDFAFMRFKGMVLVEKMYKGGQIKISERVKLNDYSITILEREGVQPKYYSITVLWFLIEGGQAK